MSPHVLAVIPSVIPSTIMVAIEPLTALSSRGTIQARFVLESRAQLSDLEWADLVVFSRNCDPIDIPLLAHLIRTHKPYIYDLDDNFFALPKGTSFADHFYKNNLLAIVEKFVRYASLVRVYSPTLRDTILPMNERVRVVLPPVDWSVISPVQHRSQGGQVKIVYATSRDQDELAKIFTPALIRILKTYPQVHGYFLGYFPEAFRSLPNVHHWSFVGDYERYMRKFSSEGFDIGLAPMLEDVFHGSKTNAKFRDYAASQIAGIYSDVALYRSCVKPGVTGLLVQNEEQSWYDAICSLVENAALRNTIQAHAHAEVRQLYVQEAFLAVWQKMIEEALSAPPASMANAVGTVASDPQVSSVVEPISAVPIRRTRLERVLWMVKKAVGVSLMILRSPSSDWINKVRIILSRASTFLYLYRANQQAQYRKGRREA